MTQTEREFLEELRRDFVPEAEEYLQTIVSGLLDLEKGGGTFPDVVENVFRAAHSLKGAAQAVQMPEISLLCQTMESIFSGMKKGIVVLEENEYDILQRAADILGSMVISPGDTDAPGSHQIRKELESLLSGKKPRSAPTFAFPGRAAPGGSPKADAGEEETLAAPDATAIPSVFAESPSADRSVSDRVPASSIVQDAPPSGTTRTEHPAQDTVRINVGKLDELLLKAEELTPVNQILATRFRELREISVLLAKWQAEWKKTHDMILESGESKRLSPFLGAFLDSTRDRLRETQGKTGDLEKAFISNRHTIEGLIGDLVGEARMILMLPCSTLLQGFPKIVRDLARDLGKEAELTLDGGNVDVDKRILEGLKDPLVHLVRNAVDHGLETPEERRAAGKPRTGSISLSVSSAEGGRVSFRLTDDGRGIDTSRVRDSAVRAGYLSREEARSLDESDARMLIFRSGVSTTPIITDISGRGLGMAIVGEKVEALGGTTAVVSSPGKGTTFEISLPVTLATLRGVLVEERGRLLVIPTANVRRVTRIRRSDIRRIENSETVSIDDTPVALVRLGSPLGLPVPSGSTERTMLPVVVVGSGSSTIAFAVDRIVDEREILLKPLGSQLKRVRNVSGATLLGSGEIVPVLNCADLAKSVCRTSGQDITSSPAEEESGKKRILVAEDSITSRTLLRNVLEAAGYEVCTAVDGKEAWNMLSDQPPDIVISDVEMPGMNGFELTAKIRSEEKFAHTPVVLVTSLESAEDRERGVEAGADAYIVKSGFDQATLLGVIRRLL